MSVYEPQAGDVVYVAGETGTRPKINLADAIKSPLKTLGKILAETVSPGITAFQAEVGDLVLPWTHVAGVINADGDLSEANAGGVERTNLWDRYAGKRVAILRPAALTAGQREILVGDWLSRHGRKYSYWAIAQHATARLFRRYASMIQLVDPPGEMCSEHEVRGFIRLKYPACPSRLRATPWLVRPADSYRYRVGPIKASELSGVATPLWAVAFEGVLERREQ